MQSFHGLLPTFIRFNIFSHCATIAKRRYAIIVSSSMTFFLYQCFKSLKISTLFNFGFLLYLLLFFCYYVFTPPSTFFCTNFVLLVFILIFRFILINSLKISITPKPLKHRVIVHRFQAPSFSAQFRFVPKINLF